MTVTFAGLTQDVFVDGDAAARVGQLRTELARTLAVVTPLTLSGPDGPLEDGQTLAAARVRAGAVLTLSRVVSEPTTTGTDPVPPATDWRELRVQSGPDSGLVRMLPWMGTITIGRSPDNDVQLSGTGVSRRHASLVCRPDGVEVVDTGSANGVRVNGVRVDGAAALPPGAVVQIGADQLVVMGVEPAGEARAALHPLPDGSLRLMNGARPAPPGMRPGKLDSPQSEQEPDPVHVVRTAQLPGPRLWERRPGRPGYLRLRVGVVKARVAIDGHAPVGEDTPGSGGLTASVSINLAASGIVAVAGDPEAARALARWLVLQAVVQTGPADLGVVVLAPPHDRRSRHAWDWVRWLPHARPTDGPLVTVGTDETSTNQRVAELSAMLTARLAAGGSSSRDQATFPSRSWLVVLDGVGPAQVPGLGEIVEHGPGAGVHVLAVDQVPAGCPVTITVTADQLGAIDRADTGPVSMVADQTSAYVAGLAARALAPLRDPREPASVGELPDEVALLDLIPGTGDPPALAAHWRSRPRQSRVLLGWAATGPIFVDLEADRPHLIIAGAAGSGKSSLLQSVVGALAATNRPDELGLLLLEGGGGDALAKLAHLPHVLGHLVDTQDAELGRLLDGLATEVAHRREILRKAGVGLFDQYHALASAGRLPPGCPARLPRLVVVVDGLEQWGERLTDALLAAIPAAPQSGLHLVVGTAAPRSVLARSLMPEATTRVALRLPAEDSREVLGTPDAAQLVVPGRGYVRHGRGVGVTAFQAAYLGGQSARSTTAPPLRVLRAPWHELGYPPPARAREQVADVVILTETVISAAAGAGVTGASRLW